MEVSYKTFTLSPTHKNMQTKNAIFKLMKKGSPRVQDMIREHCKQKWRENRLKFQNKGRKLSLIEQTDDENIKEEIKLILKNYNDKDLPDSENVNKFLKMFDITDQEIEEAELFSKNEEEITNFKVERFLSEDIIVCPICETGAFSSTYNSKINKYSCVCDNCFIEMELDHPLKELEKKIRSCWNEHSNNCRSIPKFRIDYSPQKFSIYCISCGICNSLI